MYDINLSVDLLEYKNIVPEILQSCKIERKTVLMRKFEKEIQNNRILTSEGCFGFHRAVNAKESRLTT